jgi:beta-glucosidase
MKLKFLVIFFGSLLIGCTDQNVPVYRNPVKPVEKRVRNLISLMTLEEKADMLTGKDMWHFKGIERLGIPSIQVTDCGHGVTVIINEAGQGTGTGCASCFPTGVGQAASWSEETVFAIGKAIAEETKTLGSHVLLGPMVNIHRTPLGGRNYETYSEDPYLTGKMASAFVKGIQSVNIGACIKAFAVNNQQTNQSNLSVELSERALREIYLPGFKIPIDEADPWGLMTSYNKVAGIYTGEKKQFITDIIKKEWGYNGFVVSDWRGVHSTASIDAGLDIEMPGPGKFMTKDNVLKAINDKTITEEELDDRVARIIRNLVLTKVLDWNYDGTRNQFNPAGHKDIALKAAEESIVLLKNEDNLLPLKRERIRSIAAIGPNAREARLGGGGSASVTACYSVSPLAGLINYCTDSVIISFEEGSQFIGNLPVVHTGNLVTEDRGKIVDGLKGEYYNGTRLEGEPACIRIDDKIDFTWGWAAPCESVSKSGYSVRWTGRIKAPVTGRYKLGLTSMGGGSRLFIGDKLLIDRWDEPTSRIFEAEFNKSGRYVTMFMEKDSEYDLRVEFYKSVNINSIRFEWEIPGLEDPVKKAVELASKSDVALIFAGLSNLFEGGTNDKEDIILPGNQDKLISEVAKANPNTVVVLINGTPVAMPWINEVKAVIEAYYPGQEGGNAIANILFGKVNPSGKLPETFPARVEDNPSFGNFPGENNVVHYKEGIYVGYRYYDTKNVTPLFPFGHGLSYTEFQYSNLKLEPLKDEIKVMCDIMNTGKVTGSEVVQMYIKDLESSTDRPEKELKGFNKILLQPGEKKSITFKITKDDASFFSEEKRSWVFEPGKFEILIGSSSRDIRLKDLIEMDFN